MTYNDRAPFGSSPPCIKSYVDSTLRGFTFFFSSFLSAVRISVSILHLACWHDAQVIYFFFPLPYVFLYLFRISHVDTTLSKPTFPPLFSCRVYLYIYSASLMYTVRWGDSHFFPFSFYLAVRISVSIPHLACWHDAQVMNFFFPLAVRISKSISHLACWHDTQQIHFIIIIFSCRVYFYIYSAFLMYTWRHVYIAFFSFFFPFFPPLLYVFLYLFCTLTRWRDAFIRTS